MRATWLRTGALRWTGLQTWPVFLQLFFPTRKTSMKKTFIPPLIVGIAAALMVFTAQARTAAQDDYKAGKALISAEYKVDKTACARLKHNTREVCLVQAEGKRKVARAELEYGQSGAPADEERVMQVKAMAEYETARQKCADRTGNGKDVCLKESMAIKTKALVDAKTTQKVAELKQDAAQKKRDADYSVAVEKCEALASDAKDSCVVQAKVSYSKN